MIKHVSGSSCCEETPRKLYFEKETRPDSEKEPFGSGIPNNLCSFLPRYLTLFCQQ